MLARIILPVLAILSLAGANVNCAPAGGAGDPEINTITVFAAASLAEAFTQMSDAFEAANPGVRVELHFAGSQTLRTQLVQGAAADVFASADWQQMAAVKDAELLGNTPVYFAANRIVVVAPGDGEAVRSLADLTRPGVRVALASEGVPAGIYARESLKLIANDGEYSASFSDTVLSNVVTHETSVRAVAQKVALGEVDAGFVYETDAAAAQYADALRRIEIPLELTTAAQYPIATLTEAEHPEVALAFVEFVASDAGREVLRQHGFEPSADVACHCEAGLSRRRMPATAGRFG